MRSYPRRAVAIVYACPFVLAISSRFESKFDIEGILIPFPHRTIVFKRDIDEIKFSQDSNRNLAHPSQTKLF